MNEPISNNPDERGLLPYPVILAATKGDPEAMKIVVQHYASYIAYLSTRKVRDEYGNVYLHSLENCLKIWICRIFAFTIYAIRRLRICTN